MIIPTYMYADDELIPSTEFTRPAFPLGKPLDGRERFSMTAEQAATYRYLVWAVPDHEPFVMNFRWVASRIGKSVGAIKWAVDGLVERGWLEAGDWKGPAQRYRFVHPVMKFKERG